MLGVPGMAMRGPVLAATVALMLGGCLPDLEPWRVVEPGTDAGRLPGRDGGSPQPNPIDLGTPCPNPHLLLGTTANTDETARVLHVDPATGSLCRNGDPIVEQRAFGYAIHDVEWHAETGELLGLDDGVLALDAEGFPRWRYQPFSDYYFSADWIAAYGSGSNLRIAVAWAESSSSIDHMLLLDGSGRPTNTMVEPPFFGAMIAPHPDGTARLLMPSKANANIDVYVVNDSTGAIRDMDATPLFSGTPTNLYDTYGERVHVASDVSTHRLVITHRAGVALWQVGAAPPSSAMSCSSYCGSFQASAPDPSAADAAYAVCEASGSSTRHLVRLQGGSCSLVIDGTSLGHRSLQDIALARAPL